MALDKEAKAELMSSLSLGDWCVGTGAPDMSCRLQWLLEAS
jgi:hypothetical protein